MPQYRHVEVIKEVEVPYPVIETQVEEEVVEVARHVRV